MKCIRMLLRPSIGILAIACTVVGCATNTTSPDLVVQHAFWKDKNSITGVVLATPPRATEYRVGSQGFFSNGVSYGTPEALQKHLKTLDTTRVSTLAEKIVDFLQDKGLKAVTIDESLDVSKLPVYKTKGTPTQAHFAVKDFRNLRQRYKVDRLIVLSLRKFGTVRDYNGITPVRDARAISDLNGQMINLKTNQLEWNQDVQHTSQNVQKECDVPPDFPGLTQALYGTLSQSQQLLFQQFTQNGIRLKNSD